MVYVKLLPNPNSYLHIINGFVGDKLAVKMDSWAIPMSFRIDGRDVRAAELPRKYHGKKIVVCVHGLMANERIFKHFVDWGRGFVPLHVRYNTGLHISENGQALAKILNALAEETRAKKIVLVGHSMGGLVIRSACYYGDKHGQDWVKRVPTIFLIAVPNAGAALEQLGHTTSYILKKLAKWHLNYLADIIEQRSNGIKDLRLGFMLDEDWQGNPDITQHSDARMTVPPIPGIDYHILIGNLSANEKSLLSKYFGDGLVTPASAVGMTFLNSATVKIFPRTGHNSILASTQVHRYIRGILEGL